MQIWLGPGERGLCLAFGDLRQALPARRGRARLGDCRAAEQHGRQEGAWHDRLPHLFHQHDEVDEAEAAAALTLGKDDPEPALLRQLLPEFVGDRRGFRHSRAHKPRVAFALEKAPCGLTQQFLLLGKSNVHA